MTMASLTYDFEIKQGSCGCACKIPSS